MPKKELIEYFGRFLVLTEIAREERLEVQTLRRYYKQTGKNIYRAVKLCKENSRGPIQKVEYNGEELAVSAIAKMEGLIPAVLIDCYRNQVVKDIYEAVRICKMKQRQIEEKRKEKRKEKREESEQEKKESFSKKYKQQKIVKREYEGIEVSSYDLSILLGIDYNEILVLLSDGYQISEIIDMYYGQDEGQDSKLGARRAVLDFYTQMKNRKLNPLFMYRAVYTYGKTEFEAIQAARNDGVKIPIEWINSKYGVVLEKMGIPGMQRIAIIKLLQNSFMTLGEALESNVIRKNAIELGVDPELGGALYALTRTRNRLGNEISNDIIISDEESNLIRAIQNDLVGIQGKVQEEQKGEADMVLEK